MQNSKETERLPLCEYATSFAGFEAALGNIAGFVRHSDPALVAGSSDRRWKVGGPHPSAYSSMSSRSSWIPSKALIGRRWSAR
jgi:hypothetical protein